MAMTAERLDCGILRWFEYLMRMTLFRVYEGSTEAGVMGMATSAVDQQSG